jgi:hypothetical protein
MGRGVKRPAAGSELLDAVAALGGELDGAEPQLVDCMGLGLVATRDLQAGHVLLRLPAAAVVTAEAALASSVGAAIAAEFDVVRDEHAGEVGDAGDAATDWRAEWAEREARWAREEAEEAAAAGKRGRKAVKRSAAQDSGEEESSSAPSDSDEEASDEEDEQQRRSVGARGVLCAYLTAARSAGSALPAAHVAYARSLPAAFDVPLLWPEAECSELLGGTELARSVALMRDHLRSEYDALFPHMCAAAPGLFPRSAFTWQAFLWCVPCYQCRSMCAAACALLTSVPSARAHAAYSSRCFAASCAPGAAAAADSDGEVVGDTAADDAAAAHGVLLPVLDIANHAPEGADMCVFYLRMLAHQLRKHPLLTQRARSQTLGRGNEHRCAEAQHQSWRAGVQLLWREGQRRVAASLWLCAVEQSRRSGDAAPGGHLPRRRRGRLRGGCRARARPQAAPVRRAR